LTKGYLLIRVKSFPLRPIRSPGYIRDTQTDDNRVINERVKIRL